ncbi:hypothetical protein GCM10011405_32000 [Rufibacter glacialis]|nr:hypothetical protein GCM10011405_32000 [Rufibacter glacialis]
MAKALRGELSEEEQHTFATWLQKEEAHAQQWTEALEMWEEIGTEQNLSFQPNLQVAWEKFCASNEIAPSANVIPLVPRESESDASDFAHTETTFLQKFPFLKYAAALVVAAGLAWLGYLQLSPTAAWTQVATASGQRQLFFLPDSSRVTLNGNSVLKYQTAFSGQERVVELEGEAFFDVKKNPQQPFVVKSGPAQTKVLGTSFNVKAISGEPAVSVAVLTGKVSFSSLNDKQEVLLTPGYTGYLSASGRIDKKVTVPSAAPTWRALTFQNSSLEAVTQALEEYFKVSIQVQQKKLLACTFTGTFENPDLHEVLAVLEASIEVKIIKKEEGTYSFEGKGCQ